MSSDIPRSLATISAPLIFNKASKVALTMLCGLEEPWLLDNKSVIPSNSTTARTGPPAITPVPYEAGINNTRAPLYFPF